MKMEDLRQTGRTTRMIEAAVGEARKGFSVVVVAANSFRAARLRGELIDIDTGTGRILVRPHDNSFDWDHLVPFRWREKEVVFIDHEAIEDRYRDVLKALHRFDEEGVDSNESDSYDKTVVEKGD